jgi:hypothetical protein
MVEREIVEELNLWKDQDFLNEMKNRVDEYESGRAEIVSFEDFKKNIRNR